MTAENPEGPEAVLPRSRASMRPRPMTAENGRAALASADHVGALQ